MLRPCPMNRWFFKPRQECSESTAGSRKSSDSDRNSAASKRAVANTCMEQTVDDAWQVDNQATQWYLGAGCWWQRWTVAASTYSQPLQVIMHQPWQARFALISPSETDHTHRTHLHHVTYMATVHVNRSTAIHVCSAAQIMAVLSCTRSPPYILDCTIYPGWRQLA